LAGDTRNSYGSSSIFPSSAVSVTSVACAAEVSWSRLVDGRRHVRFAQHPRQRRLCGRAVLAGRHFLQALGDLPVGVAIAVGRHVRVVLRALGGAAAALGPVGGEEAARQRRVRDQADALLVAEAVHLLLLFASDEIIEVLHRNRPRVSLPVGDHDHLRELVGGHGRAADVAHLARLNDLVERVHRLLDRRVRIEAMELVDVDVIGLQALQLLVDRGQQMLAAGADVVLRRALADADLGRDHEVLAPRHLHERGAHDLLGAAGVVVVGGVEEGDADVERALEVGRGLGLVELAPAAAALGTPGITAQADAAHDQARTAQRSILHR